MPAAGPHRTKRWRRAAESAANHALPCPDRAHLPPPHWQRQNRHLRAATVSGPQRRATGAPGLPVPTGWPQRLGPPRDCRGLQSAADERRERRPAGQHDRRPGRPARRNRQFPGHGAAQFRRLPERRPDGAHRDLPRPPPHGSLCTCATSSNTPFRPTSSRCRCATCTRVWPVTPPRGRWTTTAS